MLTTAIALVVDVDSYGAFLGLIGAVFVPMFAVLAVDYFLLGGAAALEHRRERALALVDAAARGRSASPPTG